MELKLDKRVENFLRNWLPLIIIYGIYTVGTASHVYGPSRPLMLSMTPYVLLFMGLFVLHPDFIEKRWRILWWSMILYVATFIIEVLGAASGLVFGDYWYGETLGLKLFEVPVVIGFNWVLVVLGALVLSEKICRRYMCKRNIVFISLGTGLLTTLFDFFMEPIAMRLDYWDWTIGYPPLQNYIAWFLISFFS
ncbi:MAG: carotenoid biosynthesis protein, partial [Candidatus Thermoplasmatota archaeon]|nr:carotenoid biosynthesis protein [Candidatus Thermoplasmatota archaeon]